MHQLHGELFEEIDILKREEILERILFVIEAHSRLQRLDEQAKLKAARLLQPTQDILVVRDSSQTRGPKSDEAR